MFPTLYQVIERQIDKLWTHCALKYAFVSRYAGVIREGLVGHRDNSAMCITQAIQGYWDWFHLHSLVYDMKHRGSDQCWGHLVRRGVTVNWDSIAPIAQEVTMSSV